MYCQWFCHRNRQNRHAIFVAFPRADHELVLGKVEVLHAEAQTLQQTQAGAIQEARHEPVHPIEST